MHVLLPLHGFVHWNGGLDLIRLLSSAIDEEQDCGIRLSFAVPKPSGPRQLLRVGLRRWQTFVAGDASASGASDDASLLRITREIIDGRRSIDCRDDRRGILAAAHASNADIIFPTMYPLGNDSIKRIGYVFDFQHKYLTQLFSAQARRNRDSRFARIAKDSNGIVVNSRAVAKDVERFLDVHRRRILAMPFTPYALPWWFEADPAEVQARYGIDCPYIMVCNHFWEHKDHATAFQAFARIAKDHPCGLKLVLTGDLIDHRNPHHFRRITALVDSLGIGDKIVLLGLIPKRDQIALLRGSKLLIQPTLFEGGPGGGSVYEAIGLGVPTVVSDISVNQEIDQGDIRFFRAGNATDLAEKALATLASERVRPSVATLLANGHRNLSRLGKVIVRYLNYIACDDLGTSP